MKPYFNWMTGTWPAAHRHIVNGELGALCLLVVGMRERRPEILIPEHPLNDDSLRELRRRRHTFPHKSNKEATEMQTNW